MKTLGQTLNTQYYQEFKSYDGKRYTINNPYEDTKALHLKGQMHCHTTGSDGADTPTALVTAYKNAGYDFITITDHDVVTADPGVAGITWIGSACEEVTDRHVIGYDIATQSPYTNAQMSIDYHRANGKLTSLAHPSWAFAYILDKPEITTMYDFNFTEAYNGFIDQYGDAQWDLALSDGKKVFATAVDDCHNIAGAFNLGWVVVHTDTNSKAEILESLRAGNFYASNGNDITISVSGNVITASSTNSSNFTFYGRGGQILKTESAVTSSQYTITGNEMYVRVRSQRVSNSKYAWAQPIFIDIVSNEDKEAANGKSLGLNSFMNRNAIVNGNFTEWNRGTSQVYTGAGAAEFLADHWQYFAIADGGTLPTLTQSRQIIDNVNIRNSYYNWRIAHSGAGTSLGANQQAALEQRIERASAYLSGFGRRFTVSFLARSDIANKRIGVFLTQTYGTGGSPSASDSVNGTNWTLQQWWQKFTYTFTLPTLLSKTFGTNNDDFILLRFYETWGSNIQSRVGASSAETFVGAGYVDIAQVQWFAEGTELPFMPEKFSHTAMEAKRYSHVFNTVSTTEAVAYGHAVSTTVAYVQLPLTTEMRATPTLVATAGDWQLDDGINAPTDVTAIAIDDLGFSNRKLAVLKVTVASGLTAFRPYYLVADGNAGRKLILTAEQ